MFTFFKSKKSIVKTIEAIHNEFDNASIKLLEEAKNIISGKPVIEKGERLKRLGFISAKDAAKNDEIERQNRKIAEENKKRAEAVKWIQYYAQWYPHNKFITKEIVKEICDKYNLYCGPVSQYKADVPLKNIIEMEQFKLREEDMTVETGLDRGRFRGAFSPNHFDSTGRLTELGRDEYRRLENMKYFVKESFQICAPEKDFNMDYMSKGGCFIVPDPIVLQPVTGGYLVVTKWGLEASDELVINEKGN